MTLLAGFIIGLAGSLHCIGMCGPIALALPFNSDSKWKYVSGRLLYNLGRVVTYGIFGLVFGFLGDRINVFGLQQWASIALGVILLMTVFIPLKLKTKISLLPFIVKLTGKVKILFKPLLKNESMKGFFLIGILNGFLPCGFVYVGVAGAVATGDPVSGMLFMMLFGLGTVPVMFGVTVVPSMLSLKTKLKFRKAIPVLTFLLAVIFILRGLNLGIPYLSPKMQSEKHSPPQIECCD